MQRRTGLRARIASIREVQAIYIPPVPQLVAQYQQAIATRLASQTRPSLTITDIDVPEDQPLFLPSALTSEQRAICTPGLAEIETRLRDGQLASSLDTLRCHLHIKSQMLRYKERNVRHQDPNTRARAKIETNETKIVVAAEKYRAAWNAKIALVGRGQWTGKWRELKKSDVRCLNEDNGLDGQGAGRSEGRRSLSWIWQGADATEGGSGMTEGPYP